MAQAAVGDGGGGGEALAKVEFDKAAFAKALRDNALPPYGDKSCAKYVRMALEGAGMATGGHPLFAKNYGPFLASRGFGVVASFAVDDKDKKGIDGDYVAQVGDIAVIQGTSSSTPGHIEAWEGTNWISDFIQERFWPGPSYRSEKPSYEIYRK